MRTTRVTKTRKNISAVKVASDSQGFTSTDESNTSGCDKIEFFRADEEMAFFEIDVSALNDTIDDVECALGQVYDLSF